MRILFTAFEPFGQIPSNSSLELLNLLDFNYEDVEIIKRVLPVSYNFVKNLLKSVIEEIKPDFVIHLGQAGGESRVRVEKFGLNYTRSNAIDNDGIKLLSGKIDETLPLAYETCINIEKYVDESKIETPMYVSLSCGGFICNLCYFLSLSLTKNNSLFIHLPYFDGQLSNYPTLSLEKIKDAVVYLTNCIIDSLK